MLTLGCFLVHAQHRRPGATSLERAGFVAVMPEPPYPAYRLELA